VTKKKILFLINPVAGRKKHRDYRKTIDHHIDKALFEYEVIESLQKGHATQFIRKHVKKFDIVVAVGGDGTVNEVVNGCYGTDVAVGIIPAGSGNGLAYSLGIPFKICNSLALINNYQKNLQKIDIIQVNDQIVVNQVGFGFDAHIASLFAKTQKRGLVKYAYLSLKEYFQYKNQPLAFRANGKDYHTHTFVTNFSNNSQLGNKAHIAPLADLKDGYIEVSFLKHFPKVLLPVILIRLFSKTLHRSRYYTSFKAKTACIPYQDNVILNMDGEHMEVDKDLDLKIVESGLKVIAHPSIN
jgi:diacylglycerol kinase (ATP)